MFSASVAVTVGNTFSKVWMDPSPGSSVYGDPVVLIALFIFLDSEGFTVTQVLEKRGVLENSFLSCCTSLLTAAVLC